MTVRTIGAAARDHATITLWEAATDNDLVTAEVIEEGHMYDDADFNESFTFQGATTSALYYRHLMAAAGEEFDPVADVGGWVFSTVLAALIAVNESYVRFSSFGAHLDSTSVDKHLFLFGAYDGQIFTNIYATRTSEKGAFLRASNSDDVKLINCIYTITDVSAEGSLFFSGIAVDKNVSAFNCVQFTNPAFTTGRGFYLRGTGDIRNCISVGAPQGDFDVVIAGTESNNISSDASASGTGSLINQEAVHLFVDAASNNFRLKVGSNAVDEGADVSAQGVTVDFTGAARAGIWDIGAYMASHRVSQNQKIYSYYLKKDC